GSTPTMTVDPRGLEMGAAFHAVETWSGWHQPGTAGYVRPAVKSYICAQLLACQWNVQCAWRRIRDERIANGWANSPYREAENWAYAAGWGDWQQWDVSIDFWALHKYLPFMHTTPPSFDAWAAAMEGKQHYGSGPAALDKWCNGCSK